MNEEKGARAIRFGAERISNQGKGRLYQQRRIFLLEEEENQGGGLVSVVR